MVAFAFVCSPSFADAQPMTLTALGADLGVSGNVNASGSFNRGSNTRIDVNGNVNSRTEIDFKGDRDMRGDSGRVNASSTWKVGASSTLPAGIQHAPGIEKRIEDGKGLPSGLWGWFTRKFGIHATTTASSTVDASLPNIRKIDAVAGTSTVTITWNTNEVTTGEVRYSTDEKVDVYDSVAVDATASTSHSVFIPNLKTDTKYFFTISAKDSNGNTKVTGVMKFHTKSEAKIIANLRIFFSTSIETDSDSSRIVWFTNHKADSKVWVSTNSSVDTSATATVAIADNVFLHSVTVSNLGPNTKYYYVIQSTATADANASSTGTSVVASATGSFTTDAQ